MQKNKTWVVFFLLFIFSSPFLFLFFNLTTDFKYLKKARIQTGYLISPPLFSNYFSQIFHKKWILVFLKPEVCHFECQQSIHMLERIHRRLGKESHRVVIFVESLKSSTASVALNFCLPHCSKLYLVDPLGNVMMSYSILEPYGLLRDLKYLLRVSQIG